MENETLPDYRALFEGETIPTVIVVRENGDVRINEADFNAKNDVLSPNSHRTPAGYVPPAAVDAPKPATKLTKAEAKAAAEAAALAAATDQRFTVEDGGKFYRTDATGNRLNPNGFDTAALAAAAEIIPAAE